MATRKKSDPKLTENPDMKNNEPAEPKKAGKVKKAPVQEEPAPTAEIPAKPKPAGKKKAQDTTEEPTNAPEAIAEKGKKPRKAAKNAATTPAAELFERQPSQTEPAPATETPAEETVKAKKAPKVKAAVATTKPEAEAKPARKAAKREPVAENTELVAEAAPAEPVITSEVAAPAEPAIEEEVAPEPVPEPIAVSEPVAEPQTETVVEHKNEAMVHKLVEAAEHTHETQAPETRQGTNTIKFVLAYYTTPGQSLYITAHHPLFGNGKPEEALPMQYLDADHWTAEISFADNDLTDEVTYNYLLKEADGSFVYDGGKDKKLSAQAFSAGTVNIIDSWNTAGYFGNAFFTEPFKQVLLKDNSTQTDTSQPSTVTHTFKIKFPLLQKGHVVCITGSTNALTNWSIQEPLLMQKADDYWQIKTDLSAADFPVSYKYGLFDVQNHQLVQLEESANRELFEAAAPDTETILNDGFLRVPESTWKGSGVAIPVFSLRTDKSFGCGEFSDIRSLADWCKSVGIKLIQLLPVNDTTSTKTWRDSYPYAAISAFALHAMYLNIDAMVEADNKHIADQYRDEARHLNKLDAVEYAAVNDMKWKIIHEVYPLQKEATFASPEYKAFFEDNKHWLVSYAAFCVLRDKFGSADFSTWNEFKHYDESAVSAFLQSGAEAESAGMYYFVQYHLHLQLKDAAEYAHSLGIVMKGDIAIGISRNSADAWQHPELYNLDMQAGAPPDQFAVKGQNWGFPTYNWQKMKENGFAWWKQRFSQMSNYFDAFRIDHILGFFRIWSIPTDSVEGIMGHFVPALPVHINEFHLWNTYFDYKRYCKPFINDQILSDLCGDQQWYMKDTFLTDNGDGTFSLKPEVATQKRVEHYFSIREENGHNSWLKQVLFDLISNVILFEEYGSNGQMFHFRFGMENTLSYQYLDDYTKKQLYYLSINYFYERQNEFWRHEALQKLPALARETDMLICGEDLGMVPSTVPRVMQDLGLLSLEVQRMPKDEKATFTNLNTAPYLSVVTPSTHDMSTIRGWWEEDRNLTQNFYNNQLGHHGEAPQQCEPWINKQIVEQHLYSPAMWSIFQLQDIIGY